MLFLENMVCVYGIGLTRSVLMRVLYSALSKRPRQPNINLHPGTSTYLFVPNDIYAHAW